MRRRSKAAGLLLLVGIAATAQQASVPEWPRVRVNVSILNENGTPATGLTADAFEVSDGQSVVHDAVLRPVGDAPESVCLLVDMSGSTYYALDATRAELKEFIHKLPSTDEVCLIDFSTSLHVDAPMTMDRKLVAHGVDFMKPSGSSAMLDAVYSTVNLMRRQAHYSRRVMVLVSDGGENASKSNAEALKRDLQRPGAPMLYSLVNPIGTSAQDRADQTKLEKLTEATGGLAFAVKAEKHAVPAVDDLVDAMQARYELEFTASNPTADGTERKLSVEPEKDLRDQKMKVVAPDGYVAARQ